MAAVPSAVDSNWLTIDTTANVASGRLPYSNDGGNVPNPAVPVPASAIPYDMPDVAPVSDTPLYEPSNWAGAWPTFSQGEWSQGPAQTPVADVNPQPDAEVSGLASNTRGGGVRVIQAELAGYDAHSQDTDNKGWNQYTPTGREATRRLVGADGDGFEYFWWDVAVRPTPKRLALGAVPNNSPDGTPGVLNGAQLPDYANTAYGGPGDIAYSTPAPPATSSPTDQIQAVQGAGPDWNWGQF